MSPAVSVLHERAGQYAAMRRSLGCKFISQARMLAGFADYLAARGDTTVTVTAALAWATAPDPASAACHRQRLSAVRGFARHLAAFDPSCQVPPAGLLPPAEVPAPYLYSPQEISALIHAAGTLAIPIQAATCHALILYRSQKLAIESRYGGRPGWDVARQDAAFARYLGLSRESVKRVRLHLQRHLSQ